MSFAERWRRRLQLSPASQRALTEAACDWRYEIAMARNFGERVHRHAAGAVGFLRAFLFVISGSIVEVATSHWILRLVVWQALLLFLFRASWNGWMIQRTFATLPIAVALTIISGPRAARSPVAVFVALEFVVCGAILVLSPFRPDTLVGFAAVLAWNFGMLALVSDRVRIARSRTLTTMAFFTLAFMWPAIGHGLLVLIFGSMPSEQIAMLTSALMLTSVWLALVWQQERQTKTA